MCVCVFVCMFAIGGHTVGPIGPKFCTEVRSHPGSVIGYVRTRRPHPPGRGWPRSASGGPPSPNRAFLRKLYKTKVGECPRFSGGGSGQIWRRTLPKWPGARPSGTLGSAAVVPGPIGPKLGRSVGHVGKGSGGMSGTLRPMSGVPGLGKGCLWRSVGS